MTSNPAHLVPHLADEADQGAAQMSEVSRLGYLHNSDGVHIVGPDGFPYAPEDAAEVLDSQRPRLDVSTIDVDPTSATDTENGQREIETGSAATHPADPQSATRQQSGRKQ